MTKIAVDIVLLPPDNITEMAIRLNNQLVKNFNSPIILDTSNTLPHISLAMGAIDQKDIPAIENILKVIAEKTTLGQLKINAIDIAEHTPTTKVSSLLIENTEPLQVLHENIMNELADYLSPNVNADMIYSDEPVAEYSLLWIKDYRQNAAFENFLPHITLGFGQIKNYQLLVKFKPDKLALCHLANHCTCRKVLVEIDLKKKD